MNATMQRSGRSAFFLLWAIAIGLGLISFAASSVPASAQTIYDADAAERIKGLSPQIRDQLRTIMKNSRVQLMAVLAKYGIDPNASPSIDQLMKASKELQEVARQERELVLPLLKPEEKAQYFTIVASTTQRVKDSIRR